MRLESKMTEWKELRLGDICKTNQNSYSSSDRWDFVNYLDTGNITENKISEIQLIDLEKEDLPSRAKRKVSKNSIIYSTVRPNQKHFGIIKTQPENFLVSTGFAVIDVDTRIADPDFIFYNLIQNENTESLHAIAEQTTSAYPAIKPSDIENLPITLPSLPIQKKIATILSSIDDKIKLNNKINDNLEQQAQAIFKSWFVDFEQFGGEMPETWRIGKLSEIADYLNGLAMQKFRPIENEIGLPVLKIKELRQGSCDENSELCSPTSIKKEFIIHDGDVIFSWSGSLLVDIWCGGKCGLNQHLFKVTSKQYDKWFYYLWTKHHLDRFIFLAADKATTMGHIKREELDKAEVVIPSEIDMKRISSVMQPIIDMIINNKIENIRLSKTRDELLPKLMNGDLSVDEVRI